MLLHEASRMSHLGCWWARQDGNTPVRHSTNSGGAMTACGAATSPQRHITSILSSPPVSLAVLPGRFTPGGQTQIAEESKNTSSQELCGQSWASGQLPWVSEGVKVQNKTPPGKDNPWQPSQKPFSCCLCNNKDSSQESLR